MVALHHLGRARITLCSLTITLTIFVQVDQHLHLRLRHLLLHHALANDRRPAGLSAFDHQHVKGTRCTLQADVCFRRHSSLASSWWPAWRSLSCSAPSASLPAWSLSGSSTRISSSINVSTCVMKESALMTAADRPCRARIDHVYISALIIPAAMHASDLCNGLFSSQSTCVRVCMSGDVTRGQDGRRGRGCIPGRTRG